MLMMSHMAAPDELAEHAARAVGHGARAVGIMDSAGHFLPDDVSERIGAIRAAVEVPVIFHGHDNLGMAVANSVAAARAGAGSSTAVRAASARARATPNSKYWSRCWSAPGSPPVSTCTRCWTPPSSPSVP